MDATPTLEDAIILAAAAHRGQTDKAGQPYILHPLRVMLQLEDEPARIVAVLHDVVEDTAISIDHLRRVGYAEDVLQALEALTRREGEDYAGFIERIAQNPLARRVKLADLTDNMNAARLPQPTARDRDRLARYTAAFERLSST